MLKKILLISILGILTGCGTPRPPTNWNDPESVKLRMNIEYDEFEKVTTFRGPLVGGIYGEHGSHVYIRAWKKNDSFTYQLYTVDNFPGDWKFLETAFDSNGIELPTTPISRKVDQCGKNGCWFYEIVGVDVTREYLEKNMGDGIRYKLRGKAGEAVYSIPPEIIKGFLLVVK